MNEFFNRRGKWRWLRMRTWQIEGRLIQRIGLIKEWSLKREGRISCIIVIVVILGALDAYTGMYIVGDENTITLEYLLGSLGAIVTIYLLWRRAKNQEEQIDIQIKKEVDDRFTAAVNLLGSSEASARTGAIYSLYQQAVDYKKYRKQIVQILCSHIRSKTQEPDYQKHHKYRPSNEIQTTIDLLFKERENKGLYAQFRQELPNANLFYAYCVGADFIATHCQGIILGRADCRGADFWGADCRGAALWGAYCQGTNFKRADCLGASFMRADCRGADFRGAQCQAAMFVQAQFQGANFKGADCRGAIFGGADCQGAYSSDRHQFLKHRIGKNTELGELVVSGALSQQSIDAIEKDKECCLPGWHYVMQKIIEANKDKEEKRSVPDGILSGVLENSEELQKLIKELEDIEAGKRWFIYPDDIPYDYNLDDILHGLDSIFPTNQP